MPRNLSRRAFASALASLPIFERIAHAGENWSGDYKEWSDKQIEKMLGDSPWCHKVSISMGGGGMGGGGGRGRRGGGGGGGEGGGIENGGMGPGAGGGGGGGGRGASSMESAEGGGIPQMTATVRWISALPVQQAMARRTKRELPSVHAPEYVIGIFGLRGLGRGPGANRDSAFDPDEMKQRLKSLTTLKVKGRAPISPTTIDVGSSEGATAAIFHFPSEEPLTLDDKEIEFSAKFGPMEVKTRFKPKDMVYDGKLAV